MSVMSMNCMIGGYSGLICFHLLLDVALFTLCNYSMQELYISSIASSFIKQQLGVLGNIL